MFQFTTTNVVNSKVEATSGKELWKGGEEANNNPAYFDFKRVNKFLKPNVTAIYKAVANDPEMAKISINLDGVGMEGDQLRLSIYVGLTQASQESRYANDLIYKGKPFTVDFICKKTPAETVESLYKIINKYEVLVYGEKLLNVSYNSTFLVIEATNEYQRFKKVNIEKFDAEKYHGMGDYVVQKSLEEIDEKAKNSEVTNTAEGFFPGKEGFGTYSFLLHNLRIPTSMRTRAFGVNQDETPIVGAKYNQYTIHYCVDRGILGSNAVGDTVQSKTTHVFYVNDTLATDFETALAKIGTIVSVPTVEEGSEDNE